MGRDLNKVICLFPLFPSRQLFLIPKKNWDDVNLLKSLYLFFDGTTRVTMLLTFILVPFIVYVFNLRVDKRKRGFNHFVKNYINAFAICALVSTKLSKNWPSRCVTGSFIIAWLVLSNIYAGKMIEFLNANLGMRNIQTIDELFKSDLIVNIPAAMRMLYDQDYGENVSEHYKFLHKAYKKTLMSSNQGDKHAFPDEFNFAQIFRTKKYAVAVSDNFAFTSLRMFYDTKGNDLITYVDSGAEIFYSSLTPRSSPFVEAFNEILMGIMEAGIANYQKSLAEADSNLIYIRRAKNGHLASTTPQSISITQLSYIFYFYLVSIVITVCVFLLEILFYAMPLVFNQLLRNLVDGFIKSSIV